MTSRPSPMEAPGWPWRAALSSWHVPCLFRARALVLTSGWSDQRPTASPIRIEKLAGRSWCSLRSSRFWSAWVEVSSTGGRGPALVTSSCRLVTCSTSGLTSTCPGCTTIEMTCIILPVTLLVTLLKLLVIGCFPAFNFGTPTRLSSTAPRIRA